MSRRKAPGKERGEGKKGKRKEESAEAEGGARKEEAVAIVPRTADAVQEILKLDKQSERPNYRIFRKTGNIEASESGAVFNSLLEEIMGKGKGDGGAGDVGDCGGGVVDGGDGGDGGAASKDVGCGTGKVEQNNERNEKEQINNNGRVVLSKWAIKVAVNEEGVGVMVLGVIKDSDNLVQSSCIKKRVSANCVVSKSTNYVLEGELDRTFEPYPGFRDATLQKFTNGFPYYWPSIIKEEIEHLRSSEVSEKKRTEDVAGEESAPLEEEENLNVNVADQKAKNNVFPEEASKKKRRGNPGKSKK